MEELVMGTLKGGGTKSVETFGKKPKPNGLRRLAERISLPVLRKLRAGLKSWATTVAGVATIILGIVGGAEVNMETVVLGVALIFARDGGTSSQESGIRKDDYKISVET